MTLIREQKKENVANFIPEQIIDEGGPEGRVLVVGWGSTYGSVKAAVHEANRKGISASHAHIRYLNPFPKNLRTIFGRFETILVPEINNGQLICLLRDRYPEFTFHNYNRITGMPLAVSSLTDAIERASKF
jgi:2-oxoglutarate ferredoxin oxidoreductase subunit alpha